MKNAIKHPERSEQQIREAMMFTARRARMGLQTHPFAMLGVTLATPFGSNFRPLCIALVVIVTLVSVWRWLGSNKILRERIFDRTSIVRWLVLPAVIVNALWSLVTTTIILTEGIGYTSLIMLLGSVALVFGCLLSFGLLRRLGLALTVIHLFPPFLASMAQSGNQAILLAMLFIAFFFYILRVSTMVYDDYWKAADTRQRLAAAHAGAERANRVKDQFLANMGHEIRTPLNGIIGPIELLQADNLSDEQDKYARLISSSARTLAQLIDDLLDFSKIEAEELSLNLRPFHPAQLIEEVVARHQVSAQQKALKIAINVSTLNSLCLWGDPLRIGQVVENLLTNAIKFTDQGEINIKGEYRNLSTNKRLLVITVEDTGNGIPHDIQPRIFQPFVQADDSFSRRQTGTGLGLSICKRLVELMNGHIDFESGTSGTRFEIKIPLVQADKDEIAQAISEPEWPQFENLHILVAEDNPINQTVIRSQLEKLNIKVDIVSNGAEAIDAIQRNEFDLVILDCQMPVIDGYEAARRIRTLGGRYRNIPIIALSAHALNSDVQAALAAGMNAYLNKPASIKSLSDTISRWA